MRLKNKVAVVTGASGEIGAAIAGALAGQGATVVVGYNKAAGFAAKTVQAIKKAGGKAIALQIKVSDQKNVEQATAKVLKLFGKIDILVNNAGVVKDRLMMLMSDAEWDEVIDTNLKGVFNCCRAVLRPMIAQKSGKIINISSVSAYRGVEGQTNYAAAKAGLDGLARALAKEVSRYNILVNNIAPGLIRSEATADLPLDYQQMIPLRRYGTPAEVAQVALFLASDAASYIQGETIVVDGGLMV